MGVLIELPPVAFFGNCPKCGGNDGRTDIGVDHWCFCNKHKSKWWIGSAYMVYREASNEETWKKNMKKLAGYKEVKPLYRYSKRE